MGSFKIDWKVSSVHDLCKVDKQYMPRILNAIESLADNPFPVQSKKLRDAESSYRLRIGDFRVIYQVDTQNRVVIIYHIRHRKDAYRK